MAIGNTSASTNGDGASVGIGVCHTVTLLKHYTADCHLASQDARKPASSLQIGPISPPPQRPRF